MFVDLCVRAACLCVLFCLLVCLFVCCGLFVHGVYYFMRLRVCVCGCCLCVCSLLLLFDRSFVCVVDCVFVFLLV